MSDSTRLIKNRRRPKEVILIALIFPGFHLAMLRAIWWHSQFSFTKIDFSSEGARRGCFRKRALTLLVCLSTQKFDFLAFAFTLPGVGRCSIYPSRVPPGDAASGYWLGRPCQWDRKQCHTLIWPFFRQGPYKISIGLQTLLGSLG
jgi:hypothetical protein